MFGISFTEFVLILVVALVVLGPQRLPGMLRTVGLWIHKLRQMTTEVRAQTGIDDLLRQEGFSGGLSELRSLLRGDPRALMRPLEAPPSAAVEKDPYGEVNAVDRSREQPVEGPDAQGALPDDLVGDELAPPPPPQSSSSTDASSTDASSTDASSTDASSTDASSTDASSTDASSTDAPTGTSAGSDGSHGEGPVLTDDALDSAASTGSAASAAEGPHLVDSKPGPSKEP